MDGLPEGAAGARSSASANDSPAEAVERGNQPVDLLRFLPDAAGDSLIDGDLILELDDIGRLILTAFDDSLPDEGGLDMSGERETGLPAAQSPELQSAQNGRAALPAREAITRNPDSDIDTAAVETESRFATEFDPGTVGPLIDHLGGLGNEELGFGAPEPLERVSGLGDRDGEDDGVGEAEGDDSGTVGMIAAQLALAAAADGPPLARDDTVVLDEDQQATIAVLANDSDPDGDTLNVQSVTDGANGTTALNPDGTITYTPSPDFNGNDSFTYTIDDGTGRTSTATVNVTVNDVNEPPVAQDDAFRVLLSAPLVLEPATLLANDSDSDGGALSITDVTSGPNGSVEIDADGNVVYQAAEGYLGPDSFAYTVSDGQGGTDTATVTIDVVDRFFATDPPDNVTDFPVSGTAPGGVIGSALTRAGDVNGDGFDDFVLGSNYGSYGGVANRGEAFLIFGSASGIPGDLDVGALTPAQGIRMVSDAEPDRVGFNASDAGDVNGDGFADFMINAPGNDPDGLDGAGSTFLVFGAADGLASLLDPGDGLLHLNQLGPDATIRLDGWQVQDGFTRLGTLGDINGDGLDDIGQGAASSDTGAFIYNGSAFVLYGRTDFSGHLDPGDGGLKLGDLDGTTGFRIDGLKDFDTLGISIDGVGDVNGDGIDDFLVGASDVVFGRGATGGPGAAYLVYGREGGFQDVLGPDAVLDVGNPDGQIVTRIDGLANGDNFGFILSPAGDFNGDGLSDLLLTAFVADPNGLNRGGEISVIYGQDGGLGASFDPGTLDGTNGFRIQGVEASEKLGFRASLAGDVNGDGYDDLVFASTPGGTANGEVTVLFGSPDTLPGTFLSSEITDGMGFHVMGSDTPAGFPDVLGVELDGVGDLNGDGYDDIGLSASGADTGGGTDSGEIYIINGADFLDRTTHQGGAGDDTLSGSAGADVIIGGQGNDTLTGGGGADVLRGGEGRDTIEIGAETIGTLQHGVNFQRVDGGNGLDILRVGGSGNLLDLTQIGASAIEGVEIIDLASSGNSLRIDFASFHQLIDEANPAFPNTVFVRGGSIDMVRVQDDFLPTGNQFTDPDGFIYDEYLATEGRVGTLYIEAGVDVKPVALADTATTDEDSSIVIDLLANDVDPGGGVLGITELGDPANGNVLVNPDGTVTYTPDPNFTGIDSFTYTVIDDTGATTSATATVTVNPVDEPVDAVDDAEFVQQDSVLFGSVFGNDSAPDGLGAITLVSGPSNGQLSLNPDGTFTYIPDPGFSSGTGEVTQTPIDNLSLDQLDGTNGFRVAAGERSRRIGQVAENLGDINGDGIDDIGIREFNIFDGIGKVHVIFGEAGLSTAASISPDVLDGTNGFTISGSDVGQNGNSFGSSISGGDVNGDGINDLIIGAFNADSPLSGPDHGNIYVIYGKDTVDAAGNPTGDSFGAAFSTAGLSDGTSGFRIQHSDTSLRGLGRADFLGDVNGDGFGDIGVAANLGVGSFPFPDDELFVVYGAAAPPSGVNDGDAIADIDLNNLGPTQGVKFTSGQFANASVAGGGDFNGDGINDLLLLEPARTDIQALHVIYGNQNGIPQNIDLANLDGNVGFSIVANTSPQGTWPFTASFAGDVDGDGKDDIIAVNGHVDLGVRTGNAAFLISGGLAPTAGQVAIEDLFANGDASAIFNDRFSESLISVSDAGDINGDGFADFVIGAPGKYFADYDTGTYDYDYHGRAYVLFGDANGFDPTIDLNNLPAGRAIEIVGAQDYDYAGRVVSGAGDIDGDGFDDLIVTAPNSDNLDGGAAYVIYGKDLVTATVDGPPPDQFTYRLTDVDGDSDTATVSIEVGARGALAATQNVVAGTDGDDVLPGTGGDDLLVGLGGLDQIIGGPGDDELIGGLDFDVLTGGSGDDTFRFLSTTESTDSITDFEQGDVIDIADVLDGFSSGDDILQFVNLDDGSGTDTVLEVDPSGGGSFSDLVILEGVTGLDILNMISDGSLRVDDGIV